MKKLSISLLAVISAFIGAANAASIGMTPGDVPGGSYTSPKTITGWGTSTSVGDAWGTTARGYTISQTEIDGEYMETGLCIIDQSSNSNAACVSKTDAQECGYVDENGCMYDKPQVIARNEYKLELATTTLFREVLNDLEKEAQAKYNAKLTAEQNMCIAANKGGIMGRSDMSGTYRWAKLNKRKVPTNYATSGLTNKDFTVSNDLYGSFCAARVTIQSDDAYIQEAIRNGSDWATRYFAVGDVFTCGSWIPQNRLEEIAKGVADKKQEGKHRTQLSTSQKWWAAGATILGAGAFGAGADLLQTGSGLGGLLGTDAKNTIDLGSEAWNSLQANYNDNLTVFNNQCSGDKNNSTALSRTDADITGNFLMRKYDSHGGTVPKYTCKDLDSYLSNLRNRMGVKADGTIKDPNNRRRGIDVAAGAVGGLGTLLATVETMKATNREAYDAETRQIIDEFMANVGSHIFCFIGAEEAGTFGDLVEVSME